VTNAREAAACGTIPKLVDCDVFFSKKNKPRERFYLFPGQGGRNYRRKQQVFIRWAIVASLIFGAVLATVMWWLSRPRP
jgi:hypothetical protein